MLLLMLLLACSTKLTNIEDQVVITNARFDDSRLINIVCNCCGNVTYDRGYASGQPSCFLYCLGVPIMILNSIEVFYIIRYISFYEPSDA